MPSLFLQEPDPSVRQKKPVRDSIGFDKKEVRQLAVEKAPASSTPAEVRFDPSQELHSEHGQLPKNDRFAIACLHEQKLKV